jgi:rod shape-determining protein MreD
LVFLLVLYVVLVVETQPQFRGLALWGATPDLALALLCIYGVERGAARACALGFVMGLVRDAAIGGALGPIAGIGALGGYLAGKLGRRIYKRQISTQLLFTALIALTVHFLALLFDTGGDPGEVLRALPLGVGLRTAYTAVVAPPFFWLGILFLERKRQLHAR